MLSKIFKRKLNKNKPAKVVAQATRNIPVLAPINTLPVEILAYMFEILLSLHGRPCSVDEVNKHLGSFSAPDPLLCICSHWRQVALASPTLWSHIDILLPLPGSQKVLARAKTFLERAGQSPLDIHIIDKPGRSWRLCDQPDDEYSNLDIYLKTGLAFGFPNEGIVLDDPEALEFILSIPSRASVRSIELAMTSDNMPRLFGPVLRYFFAGCTTGTLTKLTSRGGSFIRFIDPGASRSLRQSPVNALHPPTDKLDALWLSITTLHVSGGLGACLSWSSNAFKGLTDLRLDLANAIAESQLVNILKSSPKLRILKLHLCITGVLPLNSPVKPVRLNDLEVLDVVGERLTRARFGALIRWIGLGKKPLRLSLWCPLGSKSLQSFLRRSNVTELHVRIDEGEDTNMSELETIVGLSPGLRILAVDACDNGFLSSTACYGSGGGFKSSTRIDSPHLQYCQSMQIEKLHQMIKKHSIHTLTMWSSTVFEGECIALDRDIFSLCPVVKRLKRREYTPMEDWIDSIL
ncbi:hypothetical protein B0J17DRAFT_48705 [Rhizoctonia solani]|nr:hypothetical protein B0J17DRAFT_48705 [Rhizoctonia solani]